MNAVAERMEAADDTLTEAETVAGLLASDPLAFGGVHLRGPADATRTAWLAALRASLPPDTPWVRVPASSAADALLGGLDLAATLACGRPIARAGLMTRAHRGFLVLAMAERASPLLLACLQQAMDDGEVRVEREGMRACTPARFGLILLDEGQDDTSALPEGLLDRLAFSLDEAALARWRAERVQLTSEESDALGQMHGEQDPARDAASADVETDDQSLLALCAGAWQFGISSLRAPIQALAVAQACARAAGRAALTQEDLVTAGTLVFSARARQRPTPENKPADAPPPAQDSANNETQSAEDNSPAQTPEPPQQAQDASDARADSASDSPAPPPSLEADAQDPTPEEPDAGGANTPPNAEDVIASMQTALPADLLARLAPGAARQGSGRATTVGQRRMGPVRHGRPVGSRPGDPRSGLPFDLLATLRAAIPWQRLRASSGARGARLSVRASDLHVRQIKPRTRSTAVFAVDASGSAALNRLNEAKGAVESLLAQCYVRRDQVALISFRGPGAEVLLPPTRSLARVRRQLSALPGGGGTPLASGIDLASELGQELRRKGDAPVLVLLTDGRANVSRDGIGGRARAEQEAFASATLLNQQGLPALLVDIAPQPQERARLLARAMGAEYLALPAASAERLAAAVQARLPSAQAVRRV